MNRLLKTVVVSSTGPAFTSTRRPSCPTRDSRARLGSVVLLLVVFLSLAMVVLVGCRSAESPDAAGKVVLTAWFHTGQQAERQTILDQVERFNASQDDILVQLNMIPEGSYNEQVQAAAIAGDLPDLLEFDGPFLYNYVWQGYLMPLDELISQSTRDEFLPSLIEQGTFRGKLYSVGTFDSGLGLYASRSRLAAIGARIPSSPEEAWTVNEFNQILDELAQHDDAGQVLDLKLNYDGEWFTYAFSPVIQSAGGDLIDRSTYQSASGVLNGPDAVRAMTAIQSWIENGRVDPNVDDAAFTEGRVALSWSGHWDYARYAEALGDDLVLLPLPDFGQGTRTGQGSWCWGITQRCESPEAAARFLEFLLQADEVLAMADANGAVPATRTAVARSDLYQPGGPLHLFAEQLTGGYSVPRPRTPAYPMITSAFQRAFDNIRHGADVPAALTRAVAMIDQDIQDNQGYPEQH